MTLSAPDTDALLISAARSDSGARNRLLDRHRDRLRRVVG